MKSLRKAILAKIEGTYGTDSVPVAGTDAMLVRNWTFQAMNVQYDGRAQVLPFFGNDGQLVASKFAQVSFEVEIAGGGAAGTIPKYGALLKACAMSETNSPGVSTTYAPISTGEQSVTIYFYMDGQLYKMLGARGNVACKFDAGRIPVYAFTFVGLYVAVTDVALATPTLTGFTKPLPVNLANTTPVTLHAYAAPFSSLAVDLGNQMKYRNLVGAEYIVFMDRAAKGSVLMEKPLVGTKDFYSIVLAGTSGALSVQHGTVAGNIVVVAAAQAVPTSPSDSDQDGIAMLGLSLDLLPSAAGNDELSIVVK